LLGLAYCLDLINNYALNCSVLIPTNVDPEVIQHAAYNEMEDAEPPPPPANNQHIKLLSFWPINIISWFAMADGQFVLRGVNDELWTHTARQHHDVVAAVAEEEQAAHVAAVRGQSGQGGRANREPCAWSEN
jgi:hypothetical protein